MSSLFLLKYESFGIFYLNFLLKFWFKFLFKFSIIWENYYLFIIIFSTFST